MMQSIVMNIIVRLKMILPLTTTNLTTTTKMVIAGIILAMDFIVSYFGLKNKLSSYIVKLKAPITKNMIDHHTLWPCIVTSTTVIIIL